MTKLFAEYLENGLYSTDFVNEKIATCFVVI